MLAARNLDESFPNEDKKGREIFCEAPVSCFKYNDEVSSAHHFLPQQATATLQLIAKQIIIAVVFLEQ